MISRQGITELFSTFAQFGGDHFVGWVTDGALRRSIIRSQQQVGKSESTSEAFWVLYWHKAWQETSATATAGHLGAYLQEACYWTAHKLSSPTRMQSSVADCFQIAIVALPTVLKDYSPTQGASLKTFARLVFGNAIRDYLRQQREADRRTDWGLLRKLSQKQLTESLQAAGFSAATIASYCLAWTGFKTFCTPSDTPATRQLSRPTPQMWDAIAHFYNHQRHQLALPPPAATPESLERWLLACAKHARAYLNPTLTSTNLPRGEAGTGEIQDDLPDSEERSPLAALILEDEIQERQAQRLQVHQVLTTALDALDSENQVLLELYLRQGLTQQEIASKLGIKQYAISRRLSSIREKLLLALAKWSQESLHISLTSTAVKGMNAVLEEWLQEKFSSSSKEVP
jgi:RNA polymerase sigma factor (sigma-70 family)